MEVNGEAGVSYLRTAAPTPRLPASASALSDQHDSSGQVTVCWTAQCYGRYGITVPKGKLGEVRKSVPTTALGCGGG